MFYFIFIIALI